MIRYLHSKMLVLLIIILSNFDITAQSSVQTEKYLPVDLRFEHNANQPFRVNFGAIFTGPAGKTMNIPGFYNGQDEFIIRFSSSTKGDWTYTTYSTESRLSGQRGTVTVGGDTSAGLHGMVMVSDAHVQKFIYEDGTDYFPLAFELDWLFALDYENTNSIPKTEEIIRHVKDNGFNQVVMNIYAYDVGWKVAGDVPEKYDFGEPDYSVFEGTNENPDFSRLNTGFFCHLDRVIDLLNREGIIAHLMIYVWNKQVNWPEMYSEEDNMYFDYVINRYQAYPNVIWDVSKEALDYGRCDIPYINERTERIRNQDAYNRLITVHDYEYCSREPDRVDFISIQNWRPDLYSLSLEARLRHADKPVMNIEHGGYEEGPYLSFEGNYTDPKVCLQRNYQCLFAGVYSSYYWQNTAWNIVIYDPFSSDHTFAKPKFSYYKHLASLFSQYSFNSLFSYKPKLTTNGNPGMDNLASGGYALTNGSDLYMYLVPAENHQINVVIPKPQQGKLEEIWFNPYTGEYQEAGASDWWNWKSYKSPWKGEMSILILKSS